MTKFSHPKVREEALSLAKGSYQENLLLGWETWSGSSLRGRAKNWASKYARSREALLDRLEKAGLICKFVGDEVFIRRQPRKKPRPPTIWQRLRKDLWT